MLDPEITPELIAAHGLTPDEYERILEIIGRTPNFTELGIFSAMWNEHCSYKSSKNGCAPCPRRGHRSSWAGGNAGIIDIGDSRAVVFKMESHNHPSISGRIRARPPGVGGDA